MSDPTPIVKHGKRHALLRNVVEFYNLVVAVRDRPAQIEHNIGVMYGWSGIGKTEASIYAQNKTKGIRVEIKDTWTKKDFLEAILLECQVQPPRRATATMLFNMAVQSLSEDQKRPLFVDEADLAVDHGYGETLRSVAMASGVPVLLIGEEGLPSKMSRIERLDNRVVKWYAAERCNAEDVRMLAELLLDRLPVDAAVLAELTRKADGRARRIVTAMVALKEHALTRGLKAIEPGFNVESIYDGARPSRSRGGRAA